MKTKSRKRITRNQGIKRRTNVIPPRESPAEEAELHPRETQLPPAATPTALSWVIPEVIPKPSQGREREKREKKEKKKANCLDGGISV